MSSSSLWCNSSCDDRIAQCFYQLNRSLNRGDDEYIKEKYLWTSGLNFALFGVCLVSAILTSYKFNSIRVLNLKYRPTAISNVLWVFYFMCVAIRCLLLGLFYLKPDFSFTYHHHVFPSILFPAENAFRVVEVMFLALALEYQRKHRSKGFVQDVMENFNQPRFEASKTLKKIYVCKTLFCSTYTIFIIQALISLAILTATCVFVLRENSVVNSPKIIETLYWIYNGCVWAMTLSCLVVTTVILCSSNFNDSYEKNGPSKLTKLLLVVGVGLILPAKIPVFIWQNCILKDSPKVSGYYIEEPLAMAAVFLFMVVLVQEFMRLKEEAQWSVIDQREEHFSFNDSI